MMIFANRSGAGRQLAEHLTRYARRDDVIVLALPRGGVPVAFELARCLEVPLDVFIVRTIRLPGSQALSMGSIASGGLVVIDGDVVRHAQLPAAELQYAIETERGEVVRREKAYREERIALDLKGLTVILVDDGLADAAMMGCAVKALRRMLPAKIIAAVPVGDAAALVTLRPEVDELVCLFTPQDFRSVNLWYVEYPKIWDDDVRVLLHAAAENLQPTVA